MKEWQEAAIIMVIAFLLVISVTAIVAREELKKEFGEQVEKSEKEYGTLLGNYNNVLNDISELEYNLLHYECPDIFVYKNETIYNNETIYMGNYIYDVNRNGNVDFFDAFIVYQYINKNYGLVSQWIFDEYQKPIYDLLYDVNVDGVVDNLDYELIWMLSS